MRPFYVPKGDIAKIVSEAKASLLRPSRPETPMPCRQRRVLDPIPELSIAEYEKTCLSPSISDTTSKIQDQIDEFMKTGDEFTLQIRLCTRILILVHEPSIENLEYLNALIMDIDESSIDNNMLQTILHVGLDEPFLHFSAGQSRKLSLYHSILNHLTCLDIPAASFAAIFKGLTSTLQSLCTSQAPEKLIISCANDILLIFRNISSKRSSKSLFLCQNESPLAAICILMKRNSIFRKHETIMLSISRVLSKLCSNAACMAQMNNRETIESFIEILHDQAQNTPLVTRISYIMGYFTNSVGLAHEILARHINVIEHLIHIYNEKYKSDPSNQDLKDCLLRVTRLISNASLDKCIGAQIAQSQKMADMLNLLSEIDSTDSELTLNVTACIANLSFYITIHAVHEQELLDAGPLLFSKLMSSNNEIVVESLRIIANLFRISSLDFITLLPCILCLYSYGYADFITGPSRQ